MNARWIRSRRARQVATAAGCFLLLLGALLLWAAAAGIVATLEQLEPGMTRAEVVALVGEPDDESEFAEPLPLTLGHWTFHTTPFTGHQLAIAFADGRAVRIVFGNSLVENICKKLFAGPAVEMAREKQWFGPGWRVGNQGDAWTAEAGRLAMRASGGSGA